MSKATVCALVITLQRFSPITANELAKQCLIDVTGVREWLYEFEAVGIVERVGKSVKTGKSSGRSRILWRWIPHENPTKWRNHFVL